METWKTYETDFSSQKGTMEKNTYFDRNLNCNFKNHNLILNIQ